ncbi:MAG: arylamine N-acetyltransferase, partial [Candidatus Binatia bacterium]
MEPSPRNTPTQQSTTRSFDLDAYCARINYGGPRDVSVAALKGLHFAHVHNVPFENLDIHLGKPLSLEPADLFSKIVTHKRGGYCYEVNSFFTMVLRAFGFQVQGLLARVLYSFSDSRPRSHQLLLVTVDKE